MRHNAINLALAILSLIILVPYQNCGQPENTLKNSSTAAQRSLGYAKFDAADTISGPTAAVTNGTAPAMGSLPAPQIVITAPMPYTDGSGPVPAGSSDPAPSGVQTYELNLQGLAQCEDAPPVGNVTRTPICCRLDPVSNRIYRDPKKGNGDTCINYYFTCKRFPIDGDRWYERGWVDNWTYYDQIKSRIPSSQILPEDGFADVRNCLGGWVTGKDGQRIPNHCCVAKFLRNYCVRRNGEYPNPARYGAQNVSKADMAKHGCIVNDPPVQSRPLR